jgi:hypothetical protein
MTMPPMATAGCLLAAGLPSNAPGFVLLGPPNVASSFFACH